MIARAAVRLAAASLALSLLGCRAGDGGAAPSTSGTSAPTTQVGTSTTAAARPADDRVTLRGAAQLDGSPLDADVIGAVVRDGGLVTACQVELPPIEDGRYEVAVYGEQGGEGCGRPGTEVVLWTFSGDQRLFAATPVPWPAGSSEVAVDVAFSTAAPAGPMLPATELAGEVFDAAGERVEPGGRVEAFVGTTLCGVSTVRAFDDLDEFVGFSLAVVGPDSVPGCERGAPISFTVDGHPAVETLANDESLHRSFDLTLP